MNISTNRSRMNVASDRTQPALACAMLTGLPELQPLRNNPFGSKRSALMNQANLFQSLSEELFNLLRSASINIYLVDFTFGKLEFTFGVMATGSAAGKCIDIVESSDALAQCAREHRFIAITNESGSAHDDHDIMDTKVFQRLAIPLTVAEKVIGVVDIDGPVSRALFDQHIETCRNLCDDTALFVDASIARLQLNAALRSLERFEQENAELQGICRQLKLQSLTDPLTGLRNRRFFVEQIDADVSICLRKYDEWLKGPGTMLPHQADLAFFLVDIDHFKDVNDTFGHAVGDSILIQIEKRLREIARDSDYVIRWGGEEFMIVARQMDRRNCGLIAERIRMAFAYKTFDLPSGAQLAKTCSVGFACMPHSPLEPRVLNWADIVDLADRELYRAKNSGRNAWSGKCLLASEGDSFDARRGAFQSTNMTADANVTEGN